MQSLKCVSNICSCILLFLCHTAAYANQFAASSAFNSSIGLEQLTTRDGLSQNTVRCLLQDKKGFIWIGTLNGLNRYDGKKFIVYRPEYGNPHSISDTRIRELREDRYGFIWVKTFEGRFHCFDPAQERFIEYSPGNAELSYDQLFQSSTGDTWLYGHTNGCLRIQRKQGAFTAQRYQLPGSHHVNFMYEDGQHNIWIGTANGLYRLNEQGKIQDTFAATSGDQHYDFIQAFAGNGQLYFVSRRQVFAYHLQLHTFTALPMDQAQALTGAAWLNSTTLLLGTSHEGAKILQLGSGKLLPARSIFGEEIPGHIDMVISPTKEIWVNNHSGTIWYYDPVQPHSRHFTVIPPPVLRLIDDDRLSFQTDSKHNTWITTYGGGLYCYNRATDTLQHFSYHTEDPDGLSSNYLLSVLTDRSGLIWVGTEHTGLNKLVPQSFTVSHYYPDTESPRHYSSNIVKTLFEDSRGNIWVSTKNGSLNLYDSQLRKVRSLDHLFLYQSTNIYCIEEDEKGYIWLGTKGRGLYIVHLDSLQRPARQFILPEQEAGSNKNNLLYTILKDRQQRMWVGTFGAGLYLATYKGGRDLSLANYFGTHETLKDIRCLLQDKAGDIWAGTNNGLIVFNPDQLLRNKAAFKVYQSDLRHPNGLTNNVIKTICEDHAGRIWIGTYGGGLSRFIAASPKRPASFQTYTTQQGLSHDIVNGILEDEQGDLWISTENGLTRFDPDKHTFEIFYFSHNTLGNLFAEAACCKRKNGQQLWGSMDGFYSCYPLVMKTDSTEAPVVLTGFSIAGGTAKSGTAQSAISNAKEIILEPGQKVFSLEFASLAFRNPQQNKYTYILENYEDEWNPAAGFNMATYRNLPPGEYTFRVKGTNNDGSWSKQEASIRIIVKPPFWRSMPAFILYTCIIIGLILGIRLVRNRIYRLQHAVALEKELTEYKLNFFTNISHEFRTPFPSL